MEKMPYQPGAEVSMGRDRIASIATDWQRALPVLAAGRVVLRELRADDAPSLCALLTIGAVQACVLRRSFARAGVRFDQALYAIVDVDRAAAQARRPAFTRVH